MPNNQPESNRPPDRKTPNMGGNVIWYVLLLAVATLFVVSLIEGGAQAKLPYTDLVKLIEKGNNPKASITVKETNNGKEEEVRYSNLEDLKFGLHEITGKVTRKVIGPEAGKEETNVLLRTDRLGLENDNNALADLARSAGSRCVARKRPAAGKASCRCSSSWC